MAAYENAKTQKSNYKNPNVFDSTKSTNRGAYNFKGSPGGSNYLNNSYNNFNKADTGFITRGEMIQQVRPPADIVDLRPSSNAGIFSRFYYIYLYLIMIIFFCRKYSKQSTGRFYNS